MTQDELFLAMDAGYLRAARESIDEGVNCMFAVNGCNDLREKASNALNVVQEINAAITQQLKTKIEKGPRQ